ncbi:MAG: hypothetical protein PVI79_11050 [Gammaproteobacteria bacterium]|jgi:hypothetical protein
MKNLDYSRTVTPDSDAIRGGDRVIARSEAQGPDSTRGKQMSDAARRQQALLVYRDIRYRKRYREFFQ